MAQSAISLASNQIHLWLVADAQIQDAAVLHQYSQWLSQTEKTKWKRFRFAKHQHQYLVTRALVRHVLSRYTPAYEETDWKFASNAYGRPHIACATHTDSPLQFNVSHTNGLIVLAVCQEGELGVDIENMSRRGETVSLAERYFSRSECDALNTLSPTQQRERFFDLWTLKESYIKARGLGLSIPLNAFSFAFDEPAILQFEVLPKANDCANNWQFWQVQATPGYKLAVAHRNENVRTPMELLMTSATPGQASEFTPCEILRSASVN